METNRDKDYEFEKAIKEKKLETNIIAFLHYYIEYYFLGSNKTPEETPGIVLESNLASITGIFS